MILPEVIEQDGKISRKKKISERKYSMNFSIVIEIGIDRILLKVYD